MIHWRAGTVTRLTSETPHACEMRVALEEPLPGRDAAEEVRALAYTDIVGAPAEGDRVLLNVSALARGLGTGGLALVVALPDALPADPPPGPGHLVKDRYAPLQTMVLGVDDQESPHHETIAAADGLAGTPVVVADLHSALPAIIAGVRADVPDARIAYVMTDGAALPLAFSKAVAGLADAGWLHATVTVGQAYGGDYEAVTVHTGLLAARRVAAADVVIVSQGPGNLGTGTPFGFSGLVVGDHLGAAALLEGTPIAALRMSSGDARGRHWGISHHTLTAVGRVAPAGCLVPMPDISAEAGWDPALCAAAEEQLGALARHRIERVELDGLDEALAESPVRLSTMGRGLDEDRIAFIAAAAAGRAAARMLRV